MTGRETFRELCVRHRPLILPCAYDALSARLISLAGFKAVGIGGLAMLASQQALPDIGLASLAEMVDGARCVLRGTRLPWGIDADDGFGDVKSVVHTVRSFEELGCGQLCLEDQLRVGKHPGDAHSLALVSIGAMTQKLRAAQYARRDPDLQIIARTDAVSQEGLDGALLRAESYLRAGADGVFVAGLQTFEQLERVGRTLHGSLQIASVTERVMSIWPTPAELYGLGFAQVNYPNLLLSRVAAVLKQGLVELADVASGDRSPHDLPNFNEAAQSVQIALGLDQWRDIESKFGAEGR